MSPNFRRSSLTLIAGNAIAYLSLIVAAPILSRLYLPHDFAQYGAVLAVVNVFVAIAPMRLDTLLVTVQDETEARCLFVRSLLAATGYAMTLFIIGVGALAALALLDAIWSLTVLSCLLVLAGFSQICGQWALRERRVGILTSGRVIQAVGVPSCQVTWSVLQQGSLGLLGGEFLGRLVAAAWLGARARPGGLGTWATYIDALRLKVPGIRQYVLLTVTTVLGVLAQNIAFIVLPERFGSTSAGHFFLAHKVLSIPIMIVAGSVGFALLSDAAASPERDNRTLTLKTIRGLSVLLVPGYLLVSLASDSIFPLVLGEAWKDTAGIAGLLAYSFPLWGLANPLAHFGVIKGALRWPLVASALDLLVKGGAMFVTSDIFQYALVTSVASGILLLVSTLVFASHGGLVLRESLYEVGLLGLMFSGGFLVSRAIVKLLSTGLSVLVPHASISVLVGIVLLIRWRRA
jgi:O-antigen/teichoic acid export membrane protein